MMCILLADFYKLKLKTGVGLSWYLCQIYVR